MRPDYETADGDGERGSDRQCRSPFGYYGAKARLASAIVEILPPHAAWVEVFCGSAAITCAKPPAPIEVINDLDGEIVNVFRQLRTNPKRLVDLVRHTPYAKAEWEFCKANRRKGAPVERARRFLVLSMMTVNGTLGRGSAGFSFSNSYSREGHEARVNRWLRLPERLEQVVQRLRGVRVENRDANKIIEMFSERPASLLYLDPPYFVKRRHGYMIDATKEKFHEALLAACAKARCMLLISGYETELYNRILSKQRGWSRIQIKTSTRNTTGADYARSEVLWMNRQFREARESGRLPVRLSKRERGDTKVNPIRSR